MFKVFKKEVDFGGKKISLETGKVARQADGAIIATCGETVVLATAVGAKKINPEIELEGFIEEKLPPMDFGRIAAQAAKQIIVQKVREADRARQYEEYKDKVGQIINGQVKRESRERWWGLLPPPSSWIMIPYDLEGSLDKTVRIFKVPWSPGFGSLAWDICLWIFHFRSFA